MRARSSPDDPRTRRSREGMMTALRQVARDGDVTISAVSSAAGITRATFYNHVPSLEAAAWSAMSDSLEDLVARDAAARHEGSDPDVVGVESLRRIVELLREDRVLAGLADTHQADLVLPGLADVVLAQIRRFRAEFGPPSTEDPAAEDVYIAAGLYAVLATGARGERDAAAVAAVAYALLPGWMKPRS